MYCFKNQGFENEGFDPGGIASGASHRAGNQKLKDWVPDKDQVNWVPANDLR